MSDETKIPIELVLNKYRDKVADLTLQVATLEAYIDMVNSEKRAPVNVSPEPVATVGDPNV